MPNQRHLFQRDEFTCHSDGKCIAMEKRCDHFPNCQDFSDEKGCKLGKGLKKLQTEKLKFTFNATLILIVIIPDTYEQYYAPFSLTETGEVIKLDVKVKVILK